MPMAVVALGLSQRKREAADPGVADGVVAASVNGELAPGQAGERRFCQGAAGGLAIGAVAGQRQGAQPADLGRSGLAAKRPYPVSGPSGVVSAARCRATTPFPPRRRGW